MRFHHARRSHLYAVPLLWLALSGCRSEGPPTPPSAAPAPTTSTLPAAQALLLGTWIADTPQGRVTERWVRQGDALVGRSETVKDGKVVFFEELRVETTDGTTSYLAMPMGQQPPTPFRRTDDGADPNVAVFENPDNEFPKRIRYERRGDRLTATIDGGGQSATWEYTRDPSAT